MCFFEFPACRHHSFSDAVLLIAAAVVGVIIDLAMFFGYHVLWPQGFAGSFDVFAFLIALCTALALFRFKCNVMHVIVASALFGLILKLLA